MSVVQIKIEGLPELNATLAGIVPKLRRRALRNALAAGARIVRDAARVNRRTSTAGSPLATLDVRQYTRGSVERAISVRTSKFAAQAGDVGVFVNVRPLKGGIKGAKTKLGRAGRSNPNDPFYWRWLEFGTKFMSARPFLAPAASRLADALAKFTRDLGPQIQRLDSNPKDPL